MFLLLPTIEQFADLFLILYSISIILAHLLTPSIPTPRVQRPFRRVVLQRHIIDVNRHFFCLLSTACPNPNHDPVRQRRFNTGILPSMNHVSYSTGRYTAVPPHFNLVTGSTNPQRVCSLVDATLARDISISSISCGDDRSRARS